MKKENHIAELKNKDAVDKILYYVENCDQEFCVLECQFVENFFGEYFIQ